jgi:hypothetical protein
MELTRHRRTLHSWDFNAGERFVLLVLPTHLKITLLKDRSHFEVRQQELYELLIDILLANAARRQQPMGERLR